MNYDSAKQLIEQEIDQSQSIEDVKNLARALLERSSKQREMLRVLNAVVNDLISLNQI